MLKIIMRTILIINLLLFLGLSLEVNASESSEQQKQYCKIRTEKIITKDVNNKIIDNKTTEKLICNDDKKYFLTEAGIAQKCIEFKYKSADDASPNGREFVGYACKKKNGTWEIVTN